MMTPQRSFYRTLLIYLACYLPMPNRVRVMLYVLAGVRFENSKKVFIGHNVFIDVRDKTTEVKIGEHAMITSGTRILTHFLDGCAVPQTFYSGSVIIGDRVFIGLNVVIAKPCTIGSGAVVAPNSLVTRNVPPYTIVMGVPAKVIKKREIKDGIEIKVW